MVTASHTVGVVMLSWRDSDRTLAAMRRVLSLVRVAHVWVVDNESSGELTALLLASLDAAERFTVVELPENRGFSAGMNAGLQKAVSEVDLVLAINNDAYVDEWSFEKLVAEISNDNDLGMVAPTVVTPTGVVSSQGGYIGKLWALDERRRNRNPDFLTWACVLVRSAAMQQVGLLDERFFMYWEDVEFGLRLQGAGWKLRVIAEARAVHEVSASHSRAGALIQLYSSYGLITIARGVGTRSTGSALLRVLSRSAKSAASGQFAAAVSHLVGGWMGLFRPTGIPTYVRMTAVVKRNAWLGPTRGL